MKVVGSLDAMRAARASLPDPLGLVPTMGFLHEGHLSLVRHARAECASVAASIFVNPTQFAPTEDLSSYPRDLDRDLEMLEAEGVDLVWTPSEDEMYPAGFQTWVTVETLTRPLEGAHRPGHFRGVTTVVAKLFNAFQPQRAYFGQKDAQQAVVVRCMAMDLDFPLQVIICPTVREADGLAMSSRNSYFDPQQRQAAVVLFQALSRASEAFDSGEREADKLRQLMTETLAGEELARLEYISVAHPDTLEELSGPIDSGLLSMAVFIGKVRLIDNMLVGEQRES
ncbi:MAG TPA: pantoate--beta-alanine ligase [Anaerolineae bacterium]|nr:pantoate--beta-alanine ligase [Anaerolineae bacterium]